MKGTGGVIVVSADDDGTVAVTIQCGSLCGLECPTYTFCNENVKIYRDG